MIQIVYGVVLQRTSHDPYKIVEQWENVRAFRKTLNMHEGSICSNQNWPSLIQIAESMHNPKYQPVNVDMQSIDYEKCLDTLPIVF